MHVTLSEPNTFPTVCVTSFEDLTGCPWVLKTLQATKLKLKMDQNEKTTCGLMEFYHRHIMWNATLVSPGFFAFLLDYTCVEPFDVFDEHNQSNFVAISESPAFITGVC